MSENMNESNSLETMTEAAEIIRQEATEAIGEVTEAISEVTEAVENIAATEEVESIAVTEEVEQDDMIKESRGSFCQKCGLELTDDQLFCPRCGTQKGTAPALVCQKCGRTLEEGQEFCPFCGQKVHAPAKAVSGLVAKYKSLSKQLQIAIPAIAAALVVLAIVLGIVLGNSGKDFRKMFPDLVGKKYVTFAADSSWMRIDSNPDDEDSDDYTDWDTLFAANDAIVAANKQLGFPASVDNKMDNTTWSMGLQTESIKKYQVSWTYHPDKGIEALYEAK